MIADTIARQGNWFFRRRSYVLLALTPIALITLSQGEAVEIYFGETADHVYEGICIALAFVGLGIRAFTVGFIPAGTSGRNRREQVASTLNVSGMYSLTRNPLYFGNAVIYMSIAIFTEGVYFVVVMALFLVIYLERIIAAEERYLAARFGSAYTDWARSVPAFFPRFSGWKSPELEFSFKNVLRREYSGFFAIVVAFASIELLEGLLIAGRLQFDAAWVVTFIVAGIVYVTLRFLNRRTTVLHVPGR